VGRKAGDRARALSPVAENQESPAPGVGRPPRSGGADADKVDEKSTAEYWINVIARNPSPENQTALLDAYNRGTFSESVFIQIIEALLLDSSSDARAIGFTALQNNPSAAAFGLLIGILDDRVPARGLGADAQQILNGYARSESLFILSQVLGASRESLALIKATRFVQSIARLKLQLVQADEDALTTSVLTSSEWRIFGSIQGYLKKILDERGSGDEVAVAANETLPTVEELVALQGPSEASLN
jgi:hypothetical protein